MKSLQDIIAEQTALVAQTQSVLVDLQALAAVPTASTNVEVDVKEADGTQEEFVPKV